MNAPRRTPLENVFFWIWKCAFSQGEKWLPSGLWARLLQGTLLESRSPKYLSRRVNTWINRSREKACFKPKKLSRQSKKSLGRRKNVKLWSSIFACIGKMPGATSGPQPKMKVSGVNVPKQSITLAIPIEPVCKNYFIKWIWESPWRYSVLY